MDLETYGMYENPREIELLLAGMTGADSAKFHVKSQKEHVEQM